MENDLNLVMDFFKAVNCGVPSIEGEIKNWFREEVQYYDC